MRLGAGLSWQESNRGEGVFAMPPTAPTFILLSTTLLLARVAVEAQSSNPHLQQQQQQQQP